MLPLHSMVAPAEQRRVFARPPTGVRKLVLATNIAETAITIDDVVAVINAGRLKEKSYDPYTNVSTLQVGPRAVFFCRTPEPTPLHGAILCLAPFAMYPVRI